MMVLFYLLQKKQAVELCLEQFTLALMRVRKGAPVMTRRSLGRSKEGLVLRNGQAGKRSPCDKK